MFVGLSEDSKWWSQRINCFVALGPVTKVQHTKSKLIQFIAKAKASKLLKTLGVRELFPRDYNSSQVFSFVTKNIPQLCKMGLYILADQDPRLNCQERLGVFVGHFPSGSSQRDFDHFSQSFQKKSFRYYDFGKEKNLNIYGQQLAPDIPLQNIRDVPIGLFVGTKDQLSTVKDNKWAREQINSQNIAFYGEYQLGHMTFLIGNDMSYMRDVLTFINYFTVKYQRILEENQLKSQKN